MVSNESYIERYTREQKEAAEKEKKGKKNKSVPGVEKQSDSEKSGEGV